MGATLVPSVHRNRSESVLQSTNLRSVTCGGWPKASRARRSVGRTYR